MRTVRIALASVFGLLCLAVAAGAQEPARQWHTTDKVSDDWKKGSSTKIFDNRTVAEMQAALQESRKAWEREKASHGNSYSQTRSFQSWVGFGHRTTVKIKNGAVTDRHFEEYDRDGKTTSAFTEGPGEIGVHKNGAAPETMDHLYEACATSYLTQDTDINILSLEFNERGILSSCTYRPRNCADDCSEGLESVALAWEEGEEIAK